MDPDTIVNTNPWENRHQSGNFNAFIQTAKQSIVAPSELFAGTPVTGGLESPLWYGAVMGTIGIVLGQLWSVLWQLGVTAFSAAAGGQNSPQMLLQGGLGIGMGIGAIVLSPIFAVIGLFVGSGIIHLALLILGGNRNGFEATFRALAYSQAPMVLGIIPFVGPSVGGLWVMVLEIMALMRMQQIEGWRATVAVLLFPCTCLILIVAIVAIIIAFFGAAVLGSGNFADIMRQF